MVLWLAHGLFMIFYTPWTQLPIHVFLPPALQQWRMNNSRTADERNYPDSNY